MTRHFGVALLIMVALAGCSLFRRPKPAPTSAHYIVGENYQLAGNWYYPRERTQYEATGLAAIAADHKGLTVDGETFDQTAMAAAHQTLQLPAVARVTNMDNGRQLLVRLDDRGPADPARLIALTRRAAALLGVADGTRVRVELDEELTRELADQLGGGERVAVAAAPRGAVQSDALPPPPGVAQSTRNARIARPATLAEAMDHEAHVPDRLPEQVMQGSPEGGQIYLRASEFSRVDYAQRLVAQLTGLTPQVERVNSGRAESYRVRAGPFPDAASADAAMAQARAAGVIDSHLVVE